MGAEDGEDRMADDRDQNLKNIFTQKCFDLEWVKGHSRWRDFNPFTDFCFETKSVLSPIKKPTKPAGKETGQGMLRAGFSVAGPASGRTRRMPGSPVGERSRLFLRTDF
jgi:hypothetical protein